MKGLVTDSNINTYHMILYTYIPFGYILDKTRQTVWTLLLFYWLP